MMQRREFITLLGGAAAAWPIVAGAQQRDRLPTIGFLGANTPAAQSQWTAAFVQRLRELGWNDGRNLAIVYRWAEGSNERNAGIAAEFVRLKVDLILAHGTQSVLAAKQATSAIPIVAANFGDPVSTGLVASLARPGGNVTGLSVMSPDLGAKRLELFREVLPGLRRLAILVDPTNPVNVLESHEVSATASRLGLTVVTLEIRGAEDIAPAFEGLMDRADALYIVGNPLILTNIARINTLALGARQPTIAIAREYIQAGGLMSYGPNYPDLYRRAAEFVDKILRGAKPADIPVEQPTRFDLVVNMITAKAIGLTIPETFLVRADEVIE
jgi:putative ABC transport system substrate-binding protein